jgi:hypothetical protein
LLSVATLPSTEGDPHWQAGVEYQPDVCDPAGVTTDGCPLGTIITKAPNVTGMQARGSDPFTVYADIQCSPVGSIDEYQARTDAALTNGEARAVESVFWTGTAGAETIRPHLAEDTAVFDSRGILMQTAATVVTTGADIVEAMGLLEGELAECYGGVGVIHVPFTALAHLAANTLVVREGDQLRTTLGGTLVAAYSSNNRQGPTGADPAAGQAWLYGTGAITVRRGQIVHTSALAEALDRSENTMVYIAERTYVISVDCDCHLAAQASLLGLS